MSAAVIVVTAIVDDTIKSEDDIEKYLGIPTLATVPDRKDYINDKQKKKKKEKKKKTAGGKVR